MCVAKYEKKISIFFLIIAPFTEQNHKVLPCVKNISITPAATTKM